MWARTQARVDGDCTKDPSGTGSLSSGCMYQAIGSAGLTMLKKAEQRGRGACMVADAVRAASALDGDPLQLPPATAPAAATAADEDGADEDDADVDGGGRGGGAVGVAAAG